MKKRCGTIAIVGRPNVGKSTLLNRIMGQKVSITSRKPQTTRHQILGINTRDEAQFIYVDTPGLHKENKKALNRYMNYAALSALPGVDVVLWVVEALQWQEQDEWIAEQLKKLDQTIILAVNKIDRVKDRAELLPFLQKIEAMGHFASIIPISVKRDEQLDTLQSTIEKYLPEGEFQFPEDQLSDKNDRFMAAEIVREKLMRFLGQEIPYATTVTIEVFKDTGKMLQIAAVVWVEKSNQKAIVIGKQGQRLKEIATQARLDMERTFAQKVALKVWVKVKGGWTDNDKLLGELGYKE